MTAVSFRICIRREEFACSITYTVIQDFQLNLVLVKATGGNFAFVDAARIDTSCSRDYIVIPGGSDLTGTVSQLGSCHLHSYWGGAILSYSLLQHRATKYCGLKLNAEDLEFTNEVIITGSQPFEISVVTDANEVYPSVRQSGFEFSYAQIPTCAP